MASLIDNPVKLQKAIRRINQPDCFTWMNGIEITAIREGYAEGTLTLSDTSMDVTGCAHKGVLFALMDQAAAAAAVGSGYNCVTLNCESHFLTPVREKCVLTGEAHLVNTSGDITTYRTVVRRGTELIAMGTFIFYLTGVLPE